MAQVTGIGGFFFRAREPDAVNRWYAEHFRVVMMESRGYEDPGWFQDRGETVIAAFSQESDPFGAPGKSWKINFRVDDLDGMVDQLCNAGVSRRAACRDVSERALRGAEDPEGNRIQLWEPNAASTARDPGA